MKVNMTVSFVGSVIASNLKGLLFNVWIQMSAGTCKKWRHEAKVHVLSRIFS